MKENKYILLLLFAFLFVSCSVKEENKELDKKTNCKVSLVPSITDFLGEVAPEEVVAVSHYCNASFLNDSIDRISTFPQIDYEKLLEYKSCEIYGLEGFINIEQINRVQELGLHLKTVSSATVLDVIQVPIGLDSIKGKAVKEKLQDDYHHLLENKVEGTPSYLVMISNTALQVYGDGNYLTELLDTLGFKNVAEELQGLYPEMKSEYFFNHLPDIMISSDSNTVKSYLRTKYPNQLQTEKFKKIKHVEIYKDILFRPSPRFLECGEILLKEWAEK